MRNYTLNIRLAAVLVAPLLLACGSDNQGGGGTVLATVPDCGGAADQVLSTDSTGQLVCKTIPSGAAALPDCEPNTQALTANGTKATCDDLNIVDATTKTLLTTLNTIESTIIDYGTQLTTVGTAGNSQAVYVGLTKNATTKGRITSGTAVGIPAATALCRAEYGVGAHMCNVYEIYYSAAIQKNLEQGVNVTPGGWVYMQSWRHDQAAPSEVAAGLADNCGGYTAETATNNWNGTRFEWSGNADLINVPKFYANTLCTETLPIACCR